MLPLEVKDLQVEYDGRPAVGGISFHIRRGEIYGLLGPNGAGKSSTIKAILGLVRKKSGYARVYGKDIEEDAIYVKKNIGVILENTVLFNALTPAEFLEFIMSIRRCRNEQRVRQLVAAFGLEDHVNTPVINLSMGTQQKVAIIAALLAEPPLLLLDEPFNGLDIRSVKIFRELISSHAERGGSVLLSTHILDVVERMCGRVGILDRGAIVAEGTIDEVRGNMGTSLEDAFLRATHMNEEIDSILRGLE